MKSIAATLEIIRDITSALPDKVEAALIGGHGAILHGVERTTLDVDLCVWSEGLGRSGSSAFFEVLKEHLPERFSAQLRQGSKDPSDPIRHDLVLIEDTLGEFPRIDLLIARYRWELEGLRKAETVPGVPVPVMPKPYLAAMKLLASGHKDAADVAGLMGIMSEQERGLAVTLARRIGRDRKLEGILSPTVEEEPEIEGEDL
jgi:hypothetical protein